MSGKIGIIFLWRVEIFCTHTNVSNSKEYPANILWTPGLASSFQTSHGYSVNKYLPILLAGNSGFSTSFGSSVIPIYYVTDEIDSGASHVTDYRQTLTNLNAQFK